MMVVATSLLGQRRLVSKGSLVPRRSAYGVVLDDERRLLLVNTRSTGKWSFPGGGCEGGETDAETAIREVREETGVVAVGALLVEVENYWHDDTTGTNYHQVRVFFRCRPLTHTLVADCNPAADDEAERPTWVPLAQLAPEDFQGFWGEIFRLI